MTHTQVSPQAYRLFVDLFRRAVGQLLTEPNPVSAETVLQRARELLKSQAAVLRNDEVPEADLQRLSEVMGDFLEQQGRHMQHYRYSWNDMKADPTLFQGFVREILQ